MNKITASVAFDFKGESYHFATEIDVAKIITHENFYNSVYLSIANDNNIGLYTYEFEIMMDQNIVFSNATGYCASCVNNNILDLKLLKHQYNKYVCKPIISRLIKQYKLSQKDTNIVNALTDAYLLGVSA